MGNSIIIPKYHLTIAIWSNRSLSQLYLYILCKAIESETINTSLAEIQYDLKLTQHPLRRLLSQLKKLGVISVTQNNQGTQITLCKIADRKKRKQQTLESSELNSVDILPDYVTPEYAETWKRWIAYRKEIKKNYKSDSTARIAYDKMLQMANYDPEKAWSMVSRAILGQWQGLHPENDEKKRNLTNLKERAEKRGRLRSLATQILSQPTNLLSLYDGQGGNPDITGDQGQIIN